VKTSSTAGLTLTSGSAGATTVESGSTFSLGSGTEYDVTVVDTGSGQIITEKTFTSA
jgi:hypothetical protein